MCALMSSDDRLFIATHYFLNCLVALSTRAGIGRGHYVARLEMTTYNLRPISPCQSLCQRPTRRRHRRGSRPIWEGKIQQNSARNGGAAAQPKRVFQLHPPARPSSGNWLRRSSHCSIKKKPKSSQRAHSLDLSPPISLCVVDVSSVHTRGAADSQSHTRYFH